MPTVEWRDNTPGFCGLCGEPANGFFIFWASGMVEVLSACEECYFSGLMAYDRAATADPPESVQVDERESLERWAQSLIEQVKKGYTVMLTPIAETPEPADSSVGILVKNQVEEILAAMNF